MQSDEIDTVHVELPSVQSLFLQLRYNGQNLSTATGFLVQKDATHLLITNRHVVTGRHNDTDEPISKETAGLPNEVAILHHRLDHIGAWVWRLEALLDGERPRWTEHPTLGRRMDCVALPLINVADVKFYPYTLEEPSDRMKLGPAQAVSVVGFPFGLLSAGAFAIWATGFIATDLDLEHNGLPQFLIDCRSRQGQSGSPVIAHRPGGMTPLMKERTFATTPLTELLGVYSGRISKESDLGIVWKISALRDLVQSVRV
jgi:hypothetical protein